MISHVETRHVLINKFSKSLILKLMKNQKNSEVDKYEKENLSIFMEM